MTAPSVFISYSHKDEEWKDRLVTQLGVLKQEGILDLWDDRRIEVGDDWKPEIENAINRAAIAILMISANFLTSKFILDEEVPKFLARREKEGLRVIPLIVKPCAWTQVKWLSKIQARPKDGKPLSTQRAPQADADLAAFAIEIAGIVKRAKTSEVSETSEVWKISPDKISLAKLPSTSPDLFGRDDKLKELDDAWNNPRINIVSLVAWGGVGKSALVNKWLTQMGADNYRGAEQVFGWSFYSQGAAEGRQVSADQFIASALVWFGDPEMANSSASPWDKGERLAELIKGQKTLLILDGLEPLQNPPPVETGKIKDPALVSFLREMARQNRGLVIITTRLAVDDLKDFTVLPPLRGRDGEGSALERDLESLSPEAGADYLKHLGVDGTDAECQQASRDFGGHALALTLLGRYLKVVYGGDVRKRGEIPHVMDEQKQGAHARRVMKSYEHWLQGKPELDILRLMGLFDRPAQKGALDALRKEPAITGLTDKLQKLSDANWKYAVNDLRELRLIAPEDPHEPNALDCHPLLREHFGEQLKEANPAAWREGNNRLYEYYKASAKEFPNTLQEMAPLFAAVLHGCQAGKHQEALDEVYLKRIQRGDEYFSLKILGAFGVNLAALSYFFDPPWHNPVVQLREPAKDFVVSEVGFHLRALGRLREAIQPMQTTLESDVAQERWKFSAIDASNLSELYLTLGDVRQALTYAEQSVQLADRSVDWDRQMVSRTTFADILYQVGRLAEARVTFQEAEEIQKKNQPKFSFLYSLQGYQYCDLLLSQGEYAEVRERASQSLEWAKQNNAQLLTFALCNLSLGRAHLLQSQQTSEVFETSEVSQALTYLNRAVDGLRESGNQDYLPRGLLARAEYYRVAGAVERCQRDLDEAFSIATRGGMGLHLADCHLEYARLSLRAIAKQSPGDGTTPNGEGIAYSSSTMSAEERRLAMTFVHEHLSIAKEMIAKMGYHRRDKEVEELEKLLAISP